MQGWISLYRKSLESAVFKNSRLWHVWCYCLMRANHKATGVPWNGGEIKLQPGQFIFGRYEAAKDCNMSASTVRNQIARLRGMGNLDITPNNKNSLITVVNWRQYQLGKVEGNSNGTTKGQQRDTDNNETMRRMKEEKIPTNFPDKPENWLVDVDKVWLDFVTREVEPILRAEGINYRRKNLLTDVPYEALDNGLGETEWKSLFEDALRKWLRQDNRTGFFEDYFFSIVRVKGSSV